MSGLSEKIRSLFGFGENYSPAGGNMRLTDMSADDLIREGNQKEDRGELQEALACYRRAVVISPNHAPVHLNLGNALLALGYTEEGIAAYQQAIRIDPESASAYFNLANAQAQARLTDQAISTYREALRLSPNVCVGHNNLGFLLQSRGDIAGAETAYRNALGCEPDNPEANTNLGLVLMKQGLLKEAEIYARRAVELQPGDPSLRWNLSHILLSAGNYVEGFGFFESRLECTAPQFTGATARWRQLMGQPLWREGGLAGKRLLVWTEQGFGDSIMMLRYLPSIRRHGAAHLSVYSEPVLERLLEYVPGVDQVMPATQSVPPGDFDLHCPMMSLPYLFGTRLDTIPDKVPYLTVPEELKEKWRARLAGLDGKKVGLVWAGSSMLWDDAKRSIPLHLFKPLLNLAGVRLISLQKGPESKQLEELGWDMADWMGECEDFLDTAALVENLDLVIAVDTAVAHLAGALGKPVWLLNRHESEWRWRVRREDTPWYPTMRIFCQTEPVDWRGAIRQVASALEKQVRHA